MQPTYVRLNSVVLASWFLLLSTTGSASRGDSPAEIYQKRILPLLRSESPSSCRECHFQAVDLKEFMTEDPAATFAQLRARGWIDVDVPQKSKLLSFVNRTSESPTDLQSKVRASELAALTEWITAASRDQALLAVPVAKPNDLQLDTQLIRHTRRDQLLDRFVTTMWSQFERCANCHSPDRNAKQVEKNGEQMSWIVPRSPERTLELLRARKLIDVEDPKRSLIRTKPLALVEHGAGIKFPEGGETDTAWSAFLEDAARTWKATYSSNKELPKPAQRYAWRTGLHLRISQLPTELAGNLLTIALVPVPPKANSPDVIAYAESRVQPAGSWSNSLSVPLSATKWKAIDVTRPPQVDQLLKAGSYRIVIYKSTATELFQAQEAGRLDKLPVLGWTTIEAPWQSGHANSAQVVYKEMQTTDAPQTSSRD